MLVLTMYSAGKARLFMHREERKSTSKWQVFKEVNNKSGREAVI
jgi:hypothetical protein